MVTTAIAKQTVSVTETLLAFEQECGWKVAIGPYADIHRSAKSLSNQVRRSLGEERHNADAVSRLPRDIYNAALDMYNETGKVFSEDPKNCYDFVVSLHDNWSRRDYR